MCRVRVHLFACAHALAYCSMLQGTTACNADWLCNLGCQAGSTRVQTNARRQAYFLHTQAPSHQLCNTAPPPPDPIRSLPYAAGTVDPFHLHLPWIPFTCTSLPYAAGTVDPFHLHLPPGRPGAQLGVAGTTKGFTEGMKLKVGRASCVCVYVCVCMPCAWQGVRVRLHALCAWIMCVCVCML